jgi:hypothetical protein
MKGFVLAEEGHIVQVITPKNITGGASGAVFSMERYQHASIIILLGVQAAQATKILLNQCTDASGDGATAIPFALYTQESANADVLSARTQQTAAGYTPTATGGTFYVIELDANELSDGYPYVQLEITNGANADYASAVAVLSGARYAEAQSPTVLT